MNYTFKLTATGNGQGSKVGTYVAVTPNENRDCRGFVYLTQLRTGDAITVTTGDASGTGCHLYAKGTFALLIRSDGRLSFSRNVKGAPARTRVEALLPQEDGWLGKLFAPSRGQLITADEVADVFPSR